MNINRFITPYQLSLQQYCLSRQQALLVTVPVELQNNITMVSAKFCSKQELAQNVGLSGEISGIHLIMTRGYLFNPHSASVIKTVQPYSLLLPLSNLFSSENCPTVMMIFMLK